MATCRTRPNCVSLDGPSGDNRKLPCEADRRAPAGRTSRSFRDAVDSLGDGPSTINKGVTPHRRCRSHGRDTRSASPFTSSGLRCAPKISKSSVSMPPNNHAACAARTNQLDQALKRLFRLSSDPVRISTFAMSWAWLEIVSFPP